MVNENLARLRAKVLDLVLLKLHGLAGAVTAHWEKGKRQCQLSYHTIQEARRASRNDEDTDINPSVDDKRVGTGGRFATGAVAA